MYITILCITCTIITYNFSPIRGVAITHIYIQIATLARWEISLQYTAKTKLLK